MEGATISEKELVQRSQSLFDAVAVGDPTPWKIYFADDCMFFDEMGHNMDKKALVENITPLPKGYSGTITIKNVKSHIESNVAILSYDMDEKERVFGQELNARYHETDTWMRRNGEWQIVAGQVLRYYEDPAQGSTDSSDFKDYVGQYELAPGNTLTISQDERGLVMQKGKRPKVAIFPEAGPIFFRKGIEGRVIFRRGADGKVDAVIDRRNNEDLIWKKVSPS